jgi:hypothetical protein
MIGSCGGDDLLVTGYRYIRSTHGMPGAQSSLRLRSGQLERYERITMSVLGSLFRLRQARTDRHLIVTAPPTRGVSHNRLRTPGLRHCGRKVNRKPSLDELEARRAGALRQPAPERLPGPGGRADRHRARSGGIHITDQHAGTYHAYLDARAAANEARGSSQPTLRNALAPGTPEADRVAAVDAAGAAAWDGYCAAGLADPEPEAGSDPEAVVDGLAAPPGTLRPTRPRWTPR